MNTTRQTAYQEALDEGAREVMPGLAARPDDESWYYDSNYLACFYAYIEADNDDEAFDRMVRLREVFAQHGYACDNGLMHLHDADGC